MRKIPHCCLPQESGPCLSPSVADRPLRPATRRCLGEPLPHQQADRPRGPPEAPEHFLCRSCDQRRASGISHSFPWLSQSSGQVPHVLRTRSPLGHCPKATSFDLHVLGTPPAFVLSQDQTLRQHLRQFLPEGDRCLRSSARLTNLPRQDEAIPESLEDFSPYEPMTSMKGRGPSWLWFPWNCVGRRLRREVRRAVARTGFSVLSSVFKEREAVTLTGEPHRLGPAEPCSASAGSPRATRFRGGLSRYRPRPAASTQSGVLPRFNPPGQQR